MIVYLCHTFVWWWRDVRYSRAVSADVEGLSARNNVNAVCVVKWVPCRGRGERRCR